MESGQSLIDSSCLSLVNHLAPLRCIQVPDGLVSSCNLQLCYCHTDNSKHISSPRSKGLLDAQGIFHHRRCGEHEKGGAAVTGTHAEQADGEEPEHKAGYTWVNREICACQLD